ncbi:TPA: hypothetical protein ACK0KV_000617 [Raoultella ornithinolytica]
MLLTRTNSKSAFSGADIPVFKVSAAEDALFNLGVSSWIQAGEKFIRTDADGKVTGVLDRANSDVLVPVTAPPTIIDAGIKALRFASSPLIGHVDVFSADNIQTVINVCRAPLGNTRTIVGSQAASNPLLVYVDTPDTAGIRYIQNLSQTVINSTKAVKNIGWFSSVCSYNLSSASSDIFVNGEKVTTAGPVVGAISTAAGARKISVGGSGVNGASLMGAHDFALSIVLPGIAAHQDMSVMAKINALLAEFMASLTA